MSNELGTDGVTNQGGGAPLQVLDGGVTLDALKARLRAANPDHAGMVAAFDQLRRVYDESSRALSEPTVTLSEHCTFAEAIPWQIGTRLQQK